MPSGAAAAQRALHPVAAAAAAAATPPRRLEVCQNKHCRKRGAATTLRLLTELAQANGDVVEVEVADMGHTEHGCFDECTMGPNVRVDGAGPQTDGGKIVNGVKGAAACASLLGVALPADP